jgi:hypothetical protein
MTKRKDPKELIKPLTNKQQAARLAKLMTMKRDCLHNEISSDGVMTICAKCGLSFPNPETDPNGLKPGEPGAKLDDGKVMAGVLADFSLALNEVAKVGTYGAAKYSRGGWQSVPNGQERYMDAFWRHLLAMRHEKVDPPSGLLHISQIAWNCLATMELMLREEKFKGE